MLRYSIIVTGLFLSLFFYSKGKENMKETFHLTNPIIKENYQGRNLGKESKSQLIHSKSKQDKAIPIGAKRLGNLPIQILSFDPHGEGVIVSQLGKDRYHYLVMAHRNYMRYLDLNILFNGTVQIVQKDGTIENTNDYDSRYQVDPRGAEILRWKRD